MEIMIQRADSAEGRVFPPPEAGIYLTGAEPSDLTPDQRVGHKVLSLAKRNFTLWQRFAIRKPDPITRVAHLLFHHRKAMEAELDGQLGRADFFWGEFYTALSDLFG